MAQSLRHDEVSMARAARTERDTIADQLAPMAARMRRSNPRMHPLLQLVADLDGHKVEAVARGARDETLRWITARSGELPDAAWAHESFLSSIAGRSATAVRLRMGGMDWWTVRCDVPDTEVPGRTWQTEVAVVRHKGGVRLALRLLVATHEDAVNLLPAVPKLVRQLAWRSRLALHGRPLAPEAWLVDGESDALALCELIELSTRQVPVFVVSLGEGGEEPSAALIDADALARRMLGIGIVAVISGPMTYMLSVRWGKQWSCFHRAIRVYRAGFDLDRQSPYEHPLFLPHRIEAWAGGPGETIADHLLRLACAESLTRLRDNRDIVPFSKISELALQSEREAASRAGRSEEDLLTLAMQELEAKDTYILGIEDMMKDEEDRRRHADAVADELRGENHRLRRRLVVLEERIEAAGRTMEDAVHVPSTLDDVQAWAEQYLSGKVVVTPKAVRAAKRSVFQDAGIVYRALMFLGGEYHAMRVEGGDDRVERAQAALRRLGLQNEPTGDETRLREMGDEFLVDWRRRKRLLHWHLKNGGNTRHPTRCFRLYYFWDDEEDLVIVGSLPGHLETRAT